MRSAIVRRVKPARVLFLLVALGSLPGCAGYTKFRSTNLRGDLIAEWTARGGYYPISVGYRITAVERISGPPHVHISRYPSGWVTTVTGPRIVHWTTTKPEWLDQSDTTMSKEIIEVDGPAF
ncbi:MAG: hypothetical protein QOE70_4278 [Chthoniobacter sp.]|jgi:hypothetical protein|nr:hypothetical protein [Chthoniobacter sp.]